MDFIAQVIGCIREGNTYQEDWEKSYECHVLKALYDRNLKETDGKKKIQYNLLCDMAKVWSNVTLKRFMHKIGFKDFVFDLQKFVLFHLMDKISFNLPHTIYINFLRGMKTL